MYLRVLHSFPTRCSSDLNHRQIFAHGAVGARAEEKRGLLVIVPTPVLGAGERLARPPIVEHLVVVPLRDRRSEEHTSELQSLRHLVCRLLLEKKNREQSK